MKATTFSLGLRTLSTVTPYIRTLTEDEIKLLWLLLDPVVREGVSDEAWLWAIKIRLSEPANTDQQLPIHYQVLRHLFRLENGQPNFRWGLKGDLQQRMACCSTAADLIALEQSGHALLPEARQKALGQASSSLSAADW